MADTKAAQVAAITAAMVKDLREAPRDDVVVVPTISPAFVIVVVAAAWARPTTFGTAI